jgi:hypothetical protein
MNHKSRNPQNFQNSTFCDFALQNFSLHSKLVFFYRPKIEREAVE